jgi:hypothetical protein
MHGYLVHCDAVFGLPRQLLKRQRRLSAHLGQRNAETGKKRKKEGK